MKKCSKILYGIHASALIALGSVLLTIDRLRLPSKDGSLPISIAPPTTYFASALPFSFGIALILHLIDQQKYERICRTIVATGLILAFFGLLIIDPLLSRI